MIDASNKIWLILSALLLLTTKSCKFLRSRIKIATSRLPKILLHPESVYAYQGPIGSQIWTWIWESTKVIGTVHCQSNPKSL